MNCAYGSAPSSAAQMLLYSNAAETTAGNFMFGAFAELYEYAKYWNPFDIYSRREAEDEDAARTKLADGSNHPSIAIPKDRLICVRRL